MPYADREQEGLKCCPSFHGTMVVTSPHYGEPRARIHTVMFFRSHILAIRFVSLSRTDLL